MKAKKKKKEIMTVPVPKPEIPSETDNIIGALTSLQASQGWAIVVKILNDNIAYIEKSILEKCDPITKRDLTDAEVEILRIKRGLNIDLRDTPKNYAEIVNENSEAPKNYDPYFTSNDEIIKSKQKANQDDKGK